MSVLDKLDIASEFVKEFQKEIVGEENTIFFLTHVFASRYIINKNPTSFHTLINSNSGAGKDFILSKFISLFDENTCESYTRISARTLDYLHADKKDEVDNFSWDNKFLCIHDIEEDILNSSTLKLFLTEGTKTAIVKDDKVKIRKVNGRPVVIMTSAYSDPNREQLRRMNLLNLDESKEQTKKILLFEQTEHINYDYLKELLSLLKCHEVEIPFKNQLADIISSEDIFMRSFFSKILDFIRASAVLNQRRRKKNKRKLIAEEQDYNNCCKIIESMSYGLSFKPLSLTKKDILNKIWNNFGYEPFIVKDIERLIGSSYENARKHINRLSVDGIIESKISKDDFNGKPYIEYTLKHFDKVRLPKLVFFDEK